MAKFEKVLKQPTPNKLRPKTDFSGSQIFDHSTNYARFEEDPTDLRPGNGMWDRANAHIKGSKDKIGGPALTNPKNRAQ
jgi:hypothetical protein